jgi:hypothetical protein
VIAAGADLVHLGEFGASAGKADFQSFGFAEPAVGFGFGDAGDEVVADLDQTGPGVGVGAQQRAAQTALTEMILLGARSLSWADTHGGCPEKSSFVGPSGVSRHG